MVKEHVAGRGGSVVQRTDVAGVNQIEKENMLAAASSSSEAQPD